MGEKISKSEWCNICNAYESNLEPMISIAQRYGVSRTAIYRIIKNCGISRDQGSLDTSCSSCGKIFICSRNRVRNTKNIFCSRKCYYDFVNRDGKWKENKRSSRIGRKLVEEHFSKYGKEFLDRYRVYHKDKNQFNNRFTNLSVFACQGDYLRYHRGAEIIPIWDGSLPDDFSQLR
jgi:hypothetical protein